MAAIDRSLASTRKAAKAGNSLSVGAEKSISLTDSERFLSTFYEAPPHLSGRSKEKTRRFWPRVFVITGLMLIFYLWVGEGSAMHRSVVDFLREGPHNDVIAHLFNLASGGNGNGKVTLEDDMLAEAANRLWKGPLDREKAARFDDALGTLERKYGHDADCRSSLSLLNWMLGVKRYFAGKPPEKPIALFKDDDRVIELAEAMGADVSCSRPIVDAKWLERSRQVGTSGRTVKPKVYMALGISGSFQHMGGVKGNPFIIAVNKTPKPPSSRRRMWA